MVVADDYIESDMKEVIEKWQMALTDLKCDFYNTEKGTVILKRDSNDQTKIRQT